MSGNIVCFEFDDNIEVKPFDNFVCDHWKMITIMTHMGSMFKCKKRYFKITGISDEEYTMLFGNKKYVDCDDISSYEKKLEELEKSVKERVGKWRANRRLLKKLEENMKFEDVCERIFLEPCLGYEFKKGETFGQWKARNHKRNFRFQRSEHFIEFPIKSHL